MVIKNQLNVKDVEYLRAGTSIKHPPKTVDGDTLFWNWESLFDSALDIRFTLDADSFIGALCFTLEADCGIRGAQIICGRETVSRLSAGPEGYLGGDRKSTRLNSSH